MAPFELCEIERVSSPPRSLSGLGHRWLVFVLSHICLLLLRQNFEVKCVNNMEGSKCLRLMFAGKSREGTFCSRFFEKLLHLLQIDIVTQDKGFSLRCCFFIVTTKMYLII